MKSGWLVTSLVLGLTCLQGACTPAADPAADILLFSGHGTSTNDVAAFERVLTEHQFKYAVVNSDQLNAMAESVLANHRLLIVPGGNFEEIGHGLTPATTTMLRNAIRGGLNYLGICAGAFFAGDSPYNGLNLTSGVRFGFYAAESRGIRKAAVRIEMPDGRSFDQYWEDGPQLTGWGEVVARFPDGTPAVAQGAFGAGLILLAGIHAEASESWRQGMTFTTSAGVDNADAATLIDAALNHRRLAHF